jgi:hypothetical protein
MIIILRALALLYISAVSSVAVEQFSFTTRDGLVLEKVTFSRRSPDGVSFVTGDGVRKIKFENLPADLQRRFEFNPAEAADYRKRRQEAKTKQREAARHLELKQRAERERRSLLPELDTTVSGTVAKVLHNGVILSAAKATKPGKVTEIRKVQTGGPTALNPNRPPSYRSVIVEVERSKPIDIGSEFVFLESKKFARSAAKGQHISTLAYRAGNWQAEGKTGARFTTDEEVAITHAEKELAHPRAQPE